MVIGVPYHWLHKLNSLNVSAEPRKKKKMHLACTEGLGFGNGGLRLQRHMGAQSRGASRDLKHKWDDENILGSPLQRSVAVSLRHSRLEAPSPPDNFYCA